MCLEMIPGIVVPEAAVIEKNPSLILFKSGFHCFIYLTMIRKLQQIVPQIKKSCLKSFFFSFSFPRRSESTLYNLCITGYRTSVVETFCSLAI